MRGSGHRLARCSQPVWPKAAAPLGAALFLAGRNCSARRIAPRLSSRSVAGHSAARGRRASRHHRGGSGQPCHWVGVVSGAGLLLVLLAAWRQHVEITFATALAVLLLVASLATAYLVYRADARNAENVKASIHELNDLPATLRSAFCTYGR